MEPDPLVVSPDGGNFFPAFSPNGDWLAYTSDKSSRFEVYVRPYPEDGPVVQVSFEGGEEPVWSDNGSEIFYRFGRQWYAVDITYVPDCTCTAYPPTLR